MDECTAALVLMSLSCSPHSPKFNGELLVVACFMLLTRHLPGRTNESNKNRTITVLEPAAF